MKNNEQEVLDEKTAFKLIQYYCMQGQATWDEFQTRIAALKLIAGSLDLREKELESVRLENSNLKNEINNLEHELSSYRGSGENLEVLQDFKNL